MNQMKLNNTEIMLGISVTPVMNQRRERALFIPCCPVITGINRRGSTDSETGGMKLHVISILATELRCL